MALSLQYRSSKMFYYILRYIGIYLPIYWNQSLDIDARFCVSTSSNVPICIPKLEEDLILHLYLPLLHLLTKVSDWTINQMLRL